MNLGASSAFRGRRGQSLFEGVWVGRRSFSGPKSLHTAIKFWSWRGWPDGSPHPTGDAPVMKKDLQASTSKNDANVFEVKTFVFESKNTFDLRGFF